MPMSKKKKNKGKTPYLTQLPNLDVEQDGKIREVMKQARRDVYSDMREDCELPLPKTPSPINCDKCELDCPYNRLY